MRTRRLVRGLVVLVITGLVASCSVVADTTAATVGGETISVDRVDEIVDNETLMSLLGLSGFGEQNDESRLSGDLARAALGFEMERVALVQLVDELHIGSDPAVDADAIAQEADAWLAQQEAGSGAVFDSETRELLSSYVTAQLSLFAHTQSPRAAEEETLRVLYDSYAARWNQSCVTVVGAPFQVLDEVVELRRAGGGVDRIAAEVEGSEVVVRPDMGCVSRMELPAQLADVIDSLRPGRTSQVVEMDGAVYVVRLESTVHVGFDEAAPELLAMLQSVQESGTQVLTAGELASATVNPRYGSGMSPQGQILPPPTPVIPMVSLPEIDHDHEHDHEH